MPEKKPVKKIEKIDAAAAADADAVCQKDQHATTWSEAAEEIEKELDANEPTTAEAVKDLRDHAAG